MPPLWFVLVGWGIVKQDSFVRIRDVRIVGRGAVLRDHFRSVAHPGVVDEEPMVVGVERMKGQTEQSLFATHDDFGVNVEKDRRRCRARLQHLDHAGLFDDEEPIRVIACVADEHRTREARNNLRQLNGGEE